MLLSRLASRSSGVLPFAVAGTALVAMLMNGSAVHAQGGGVFVSEYGADQVRAINATGTSSTAWTGVDNPWGLALDGFNNLFVIEADFNTVGQFTPGGTFAGRSGTIPVPPSDTPQSHGVIGVGGQIYISTDTVTTPNTDDIYTYTYNPVPSVAPSSGTLVPAQPVLDNPVLMTIRPSTGTAGTPNGRTGSLVVSNQGNNSLSFHDPFTGSISSTFTDGNLNRPHSTAFLGNRMYVANFGANNILVYNVSGAVPTFITSFNTSVSSPTDLMFDANGRLYVTMEGTGTVERYAPGGAHLGTFFSGLNTPKSLIIGNNGSSQGNAVLPSTVTPGGAFVFSNVATGRWFDPPVNPGYDFAMTDANGFASIDALPTGFAFGMEVTATDGVTTNTWSNLSSGSSVDFTAFFGAGGATSFSVTGLSPLTDPTDTLAFPIALSFTSEIASFTMTPQVVVVPEAGTLGLMLMAGAPVLSGIGLIRRRVKK